jgi:predicted dehydrogenase
MNDFAWVVIGPGLIAHRFADAVFRLPGMYTRSVLGRDTAAAGQFVAHWSRPGKPAPLVAPDLASLLADAAVDAVYIATPHSAHAPFVRECLAAGRPVLCEKPLVPNLATAREIVAQARDRNVFLMEAFWTRFLPVYSRVGRWLGEGAIGRVRAIQSSFCGPVTFDPEDRHYSPALAGGALLDIGVYCLAMSRWVLELALGACPEPTGLHVDGVLAPTGVDQRCAATIVFPDGVLAQFLCGFDCIADNSLRIFGDAGCISVPHTFWEGTHAVLTRPGQAPETVHAPFRFNGFEYEIEEAMRSVRSGLVESPRMPHAETLANLAMIDELRRQLGVRYPFE